MRLASRARVGWGYAVIGWCHFAAGRYEQAVSMLQLALDEDRIPVYFLGLASSYAHLGRLAEARNMLAARPEGALATFTPAFVRSSRNSDYDARLVEGLRLAASSQT
ncbi:MAG: hypothetical protein Q8K93_02770 [Reyranella sp.]|nr:hypothetical protein [Reyranella sp.]